METTKKITKQQKMFNYFLSLNSEYENFKNYNHIFTYEKENFFNVAIFSKRGIKPEIHFKFNSEIERSYYLKSYKETNLKRIEEIEKMRNARLKESEKFQKGAILVSSWGYEQTNIDFYLIIERKNKTVILQELGQNKHYSHTTMSGTCTPNINIFKGKPFQKRISQYGDINLESYKYCQLFDGKPQDFSCYA